MSDLRDLRHRMRSWADEQLESSAPGRQLRIEKALIVLKNRLGDRPCTILDAGAETGLFARAAASRSPRWRIVAIDLSYSALSRGRAATASRPWREQIAFVQADLTCGLGRDLFDAAVMLEALVEIPDDAAALESVAAALRPGASWFSKPPPTTGLQCWRGQTEPGAGRPGMVTTRTDCGPWPDGLVWTC